MLSRRNFLSQAGLVSGAALAFPGNAPAEKPSTTIPTSVDLSTSYILLKHLRQMGLNPRHNPFASGELATAYRMHCDSLESTGLNAAIQLANKQSGPYMFTPTSLDSHFELLRKAGVPISESNKQVLISNLLAIDPRVVGKTHETLQTVPLLRQQQALHSVMILAQKKAARDAQTVAIAGGSTPHLLPSAYRISRGLNAFQVDDPYSVDVWASADDGVNLDLFFMGGGASGLGSGGGVGSALSFSSWGLPDYYTTPSGQPIQWCTVYATMGALAAGGLSAVLAYIAAQGTSIPALVAIGIDPAALAGLLAIIAAYWAACAVLC